MDKSYEKFKDLLVKGVKDYYGNVARIFITQVKKLNWPDDNALQILQKDDTVCPNIYLNAFYEEWNAGRCMESIVEEILHLYRKYRSFPVNFDVNAINDFQKVKKHLFCMLVNYERNREVLEDVLYQRFLDLALVYYYETEDANGSKGIVTIMNDYLGVWSITKEQIHRIALKNTIDQMDFQLMLMQPDYDEELLLGQENMEQSKPLKETEIVKIMDAVPPLYILSNQNATYGAAGMFFDDVLRMVGDRFKEDYYVLPSSIHECIVYPEGTFKFFGLEQMKELVMSVNESLFPGDFLSDSIYRYSCKEHTLVIAA